MARSVLRKIAELSEEREKLVALEARQRAGDEERRRLAQIDHDLQVLWDLRRRELAGERIDLDQDYFDHYTVDPGDDPPNQYR